MKAFNQLRKGLTGIIFPHICLHCSRQLSGSEHYLCNYCMQSAFDESPFNKPGMAGEVFLPEAVKGHVALWNYDKGGYLQEILHQLKYNGYTNLGIDLGRMLGQRVLDSGLLTGAGSETVSNAVLLPVPLHPARMRKRGFNQAASIARGIQQVCSISVISEEVVTRVKNTKTQTGFSLNKRQNNIRGAFKVNAPSALSGKTLIIVDDVFTTGSTTFGLAAVLQEADPEEILIATVARA